MICFVNRTTVDYDIRLQKYVQSCLTNQVPYCVIGWDRDGQCSKLFPNEYQYKVKAPYGGGWKNFIPLIGWLFFVWYHLIKLWGKYKVIHACNIENCMASYPLKFFGKKIVLDIYDTVKPELEARIAQKIDGLILPSDMRLKQIGISKENCKHYLEVENVPFFNQEVKRKIIVDFPVKIHLAYVGVMQREIRGIENVVELVKNDDRFLFEVAGTGDGLDEELRQAAKECSRIKYYGKVDYGKALQIESDADFIIAMYYLKAKVHEYASPNKYYESLYLGKPVITTKGTLVGNNVEKYNTGYVIGETVEDIKVLFKDISSDIFLKEYRKKIQNCDKLWNSTYKDYYKNVTEGSYLAMMKEIAG